jgi:8-hydroxy-5-deazaflavin:NADPH oxidoreductase
MKIGVLGSGMVGQTLASKLIEMGHQVVVGTRNPEKLQEWKEKQNTDNLLIGSFSEAAGHGEIVFNATSGTGALEALRLAGTKQLNGKILIDVSNPFDVSKEGMPPTLFVSNDNSLGEQIQTAFPEVKVVKSLNTLSAPLMVNPGSLAGGDHTIFVSGNDAEAKAKVTEFLKQWFGWKNIIDLGDITTGRGTEMLMAIWVRLYGALGTPMFNFKIVQ